MGLIEDIEFANENKTERDSFVDKRMDKISDLARRTGTVNQFTLENFKNPDFFYSLPQDIRDSDEKLLELLSNNSLFNNIIHRERLKKWANDTSSLFGDDTAIAETFHDNGRVRRDESGYKINVEYLISQGIDPSKVLFFRRTQIADKPKPEYYWTSDYAEVQWGLTREIPPSQRQSSVILISDLTTINNNEGLIQDINDDQGLSVRQIGSGTFDQNLALGKIEQK